MAGSQGLLDAGGIPQSTSPGIGGGWSSARMRVISSADGSTSGGRDALAAEVDEPDASALERVGGFASISFDTCARGWLVIGGGLRITT